MLWRLTPRLTTQLLIVAGSAYSIFVVKFTVANSEAMLYQSSGTWGCMGSIHYVAHVTDFKLLLPILKPSNWSMTLNLPPFKKVNDGTKIPKVRIVSNLICTSLFIHSFIYSFIHSASIYRVLNYILGIAWGPGNTGVSHKNKSLTMCSLWSNRRQRCEINHQTYNYIL